MRGFADTLQKFKPIILVGYATSLYTFANFLLSEGNYKLLMFEVKRSPQCCLTKLRISMGREPNSEKDVILWSMSFFLNSEE